MIVRVLGPLAEQLDLSIPEHAKVVVERAGQPVGVCRSLFQSQSQSQIQSQSQSQSQMQAVELDRQTPGRLAVLRPRDAQKEVDRIIERQEVNREGSDAWPGR